jgi:hypothetical protein
MWAAIVAVAKAIGTSALNYVLAHKDELIAMGISAAIELIKRLFS